MEHAIERFGTRAVPWVLTQGRSLRAQSFAKVLDGHCCTQSRHEKDYTEKKFRYNPGRRRVERSAQGVAPAFLKPNHPPGP